MSNRRKDNKPTGVNWIKVDTLESKKLNAKKALEIMHEAEAKNPLHYTKMDSKTWVGKHK